MSLVEWIEFPDLGDDRGSLVALEGGSTIPFEIRRVYYIFNTTKDVARGSHAHKALRQVAVCLSGQCRMIFNDGEKREDFLLDSQTKGVMIDSMIWHEMYAFSSDCILLVLASDRYDESDYIRNYQDFVEALK